MKKEKIIHIASVAFILFSAFCLLMVSLMAFANPQSVMDLVSVKLTNNDAFSSIRGIYGGVGLTIVLSLIYLVRKHRSEALLFLTVLWGLYAVSRLITIMVEGPLGDFGTQWIVTESVLCGIALLLLKSSKQLKQATL
ncbi:MAG: DUF4345 domain-containing protein [Cyclobacteriaceae bacterium]|jgi:uncharacterized membrane protein|nr:DUF4345 domain-containing protein [Cyclobacteriaceae bacterium]